MSEMPKPDTKVDVILGLSRGDLADLCQAADDAIKAGGGFGWLTPPRRDIMETYWKGVLMVPERTLIVGRLDNVIVGSAQLVRPTKNNEAQAHSGQLTTSFMAPWARGHGLARINRKSTRLNSSHSQISYAVFCLKKKKKKKKKISHTIKTYIKRKHALHQSNPNRVGHHETRPYVAINV